MGFNSVFKGLMFIIPTYAQISGVKINIKITPTCFGVNTSSSGCLHFGLAEVMNYSAQKHHTHTHTHLTRNYIYGHIYQDIIITTHYIRGVSVQ